MEYFLKILAVCLAACLAGLFLRGSEFRSLASLCGLALGGILLVSLLKPVTELIQELVSAAGMEPAVFLPVLKAAGIGLLTQTAGSFCADAGEKALEKLLELGGVVSILYVSLPLFSAVLDMLRSLMEG